MTLCRFYRLNDFDMSYYREIYCCECKQVVQARFTDWKEVYPHLRELPYKHFYICDKCKNFVGVHKGTNIPLGTIPTKEIKEFRKKIHSIIDPIFLKSKNKNYTRKKIYHFLSEKINKEYHTATLSSIEDCENVIKYLNDYREVLLGFCL